MEHHLMARRGPMKSPLLVYQYISRQSRLYAFFWKFAFWLGCPKSQKLTEPDVFKKSLMMGIIKICQNGVFWILQKNLLMSIDVHGFGFKWCTIIVLILWSHDNQKAEFPENLSIVETNWKRCVFISKSGITIKLGRMVTYDHLLLSIL